MAERICSIDGCDKPHLARGWCQHHYGIWRRTGDPSSSVRPYRLSGSRLRGLEPFDRFLHYVEITETCWLWRGSQQANGYGSFTPTSGRSVRAHRYAYETLIGPIPEGLEIDHLCRVRNCVNPDHMECVTRLENMARAELRRGDNHHHGAKTHCPQGHPYDEVNTYRLKGRRYCKTCQRAALAAFYERKRNAA